MAATAQSGQDRVEVEEETLQMELMQLQTLLEEMEELEQQVQFLVHQ